MKKELFGDFYAFHKKPRRKREKDTIRHLKKKIHKHLRKKGFTLNPADGVVVKKEPFVFSPFWTIGYKIAATKETA